MSERHRFVASLTVPSRVESIRLAALFLVQAASAFKLPAVKGGQYEVAVVEALNNAVQHGGGNPDTCIVCEFEIDGRCLRIRVLEEASAAPVEPAPSHGVTPSLQRMADGLHHVAAVFPGLRPVSRGGHHGIEMELNF
jgi:anti-sigma regulatory factor (Ser/Thr protein kinase)